MPGSYRIDEELGVVFTTASGVLTDSDIMDHQERLMADPAFRPEMNQLLDATGVTKDLLTGEGIWAAAQRDMYGRNSRRAIVATNDVTYGMARMFAIIRNHGPEIIKVFRDLDEAKAWLGLK